jgi:FdhD protein
MNLLDKEDIIALDVAFCVFINEDFYRTFIVTPDKLREFMIGNLISEAIIDSPNVIKEIEILSSKIYVTLDHKIDLLSISRENADLITTACGLTSAPSKNLLKALWNDSPFVLTPEKIWYAARELHKKSDIYLSTGGTHSAILYSPKSESWVFAADVGRHNAVDKVVGEGICEGIDLRNCVLISSGRLSGEIVLKAARSGIPIIASVSGPLESGIQIAEETGLTLLGFIRGKRMNLYSHINRIRFE